MVGIVSIHVERDDRTGLHGLTKCACGVLWIACGCRLGSGSSLLLMYTVCGKSSSWDRGSCLGALSSQMLQCAYAGRQGTLVEGDVEDLWSHCLMYSCPYA